MLYKNEAKVLKLNRICFLTDDVVLSLHPRFENILYDSFAIGHDNKFDFNEGNKLDFNEGNKLEFNEGNKFDFSKGNKLEPQLFSISINSTLEFLQNYMMNLFLDLILLPFLITRFFPRAR